MLCNIYKIQVRYNEIDSMGIAHNGAYFAWLDMARIRLLEQIGISYKDLEAQGFYLPVIQTHMEYKRSCCFDEVLHIYSQMGYSKGLRFKVDFKIMRSDTKIALGYTTLACVNNQGMPCRPPAKLLEGLQQAQICSTTL